jgi:hypothetical protein
MLKTRPQGCPLNKNYSLRPNIKIGSANISIYYQNVRGLCTKTHEFYLSSLSSTSNFDIIALTETWLNDSVSDGELLDLDRFNVFRKDRNSCRH